MYCVRTIVTVQYYTSVNASVYAECVSICRIRQCVPNASVCRIRQYVPNTSAYAEYVRMCRVRQYVPNTSVSAVMHLFSKHSKCGERVVLHITVYIKLYYSLEEECYIMLSVVVVSHN